MYQTATAITSSASELGLGDVRALVERVGDIRCQPRSAIVNAENNDATSCEERREPSELR